MTAARARMSDEEFRADLDVRRDAVDAVAADIVAAQHTPVTFYGRRRYETIVLALVTVPSRETPRSIWASCDGDDSKAVCIPKSQIKIVQREGDRFILTTMKAWIAIDRHMAQANIPGLTKAVKWTDEERAAWKLIQARISGVRQALAEENRPRRFRTRFSRKPVAPRNYFA
jgi:hypothetical protein